MSLHRGRLVKAAVGLLSVTALLVGSAQSVEAATTYYVATTGNDAASGSEAAPWRTLQRAADAVVAGDTVIVRSGTYAGFQITEDGTPNARITFRAESGVLVNAKHSSVSAFAGAINLEGADYVTIEGFQVKLATYGSVRSNIRSVENTGAIIRGNSIDNASWWGILSGNSTNLTVEYNTITNTKVQHGIYVGNSADNPIIRGNFVAHSRGAGIQVNADKDLPGDGIISTALIEGNVLLDNCSGESASLNLNGVEDSRVLNNVIASQYRNGIAMYQDNQTAGTKRNLVAYNTIVGPPWYGISISGAGSVGNRIYNNILFTQGWDSSFRGGLGVENITGLESDHNVLMGRVNRDPGDTESPSEAPSQWRNRGLDTHSLFLEDHFGSPESALQALFAKSPGWPLWSAHEGDYHLISGSPALDRAKVLPEVPVDIDRKPRGASPDVGAYELVGGEPPPPPTPTPTPQPTPGPTPGPTPDPGPQPSPTPGPTTPPPSPAPTPDLAACCQLVVTAGPDLNPPLGRRTGITGAVACLAPQGGVRALTRTEKRRLMTQWVSMSPAVRFTRPRRLATKIRVSMTPDGQPAEVMLGAVVAPIGACPLTQALDSALIDTAP